ncbi:hypothetical protein B0H15DRAFT_802831 [Mycena belliarum]|uniref:F-box domain-containing protein n=1 Tax=Mycena belliarum TaxID=1033014 RepID=A0AAD6XJQ5_9AGAR|nr:hypothetical protein B0H15DRAFT_802831 [Mycena belliae]
MTDWMSLPVETWVEILHFVRSSSTRDLADLCLTCSDLSSIARPVLYNDLTLYTTTPECEPNLSAQTTLALLARDEALSRSVRRLTLNGAQDSELDINDAAILAHIASLRNMKQLMCLKIIGAVFLYAAEDLKAEYVQVLAGLPLEELSLPFPGCFPDFSEQHFAQFANLKSIDCYTDVDHHEYFKLPCLRLLSNSATTLTSLSLSAMYIDDWSLEVFALRFPLLRALTIGTWDEEIHTPAGFNDFILAHHETLEYLALGYTERREICAAALVFGDGLSPHILPNLREFKGHCQNIEMMARACMRCLGNTFTKVTVGASRIGDPMGAINTMLDALQTYRLCALKELDFDLFCWDFDEREAVPDFIRRWGAICGASLEVWRGRVPFVWTWSTEELAGFFAAFAKMRVLWIAHDSTVFGVYPRMELEEEDDEDEPVPEVDFEAYLRALAESCPSLDEVWVMWGHKDVCWRIERGSGPSNAKLNVRLIH